MNDTDGALAALASKQYGLLSQCQLSEHGIGPDRVRSRVRSGRWERVGPKVIRIAGTAPTWHQRALAACLAHPDAVASWLTAAALAGVCPPPTPPHITVPFGRSARSKLAVVHRARLHPIDRTVIAGVPCTTLARTLVDCAKPLGPRRLQMLVDEAAQGAGLRPAAVDQAWERSQAAPGRWGEDKLMTALEPWRNEIRPGSPAEVRLKQRLRQWGYPEPEAQVEVLDDDGSVIARVDLGWRDRLVGLEYEGERFHGPNRWAADNERHRRTSARGWTLIYVGKHDLLPGATALRNDLARIWPR